MPRERDIHKACVEFLRYALPSDTVVMHPANEGRRGWQSQRDLKPFGMLKGAPDLFIFWRGKTFAIELKAPGRYPTADQRSCHHTLRRAGIEVAICRSVAELELTLNSWAIPLMAKVAA